MCVFSYNSRGFSEQTQEFCKYLLNSVGSKKLAILCNQENFILKGNCYKIQQTFPDYYPIIKPALKETLDKGRGRNGMFILIPNDLKSLVIDVSPSHWRIQAAIIDLKSSKLLIINSYFPQDNRNDGDVADLLETIECIRHVLHDNVFNDVLWMGDINANFVRKTAHCQIVKQFVQELPLLHSWDEYEVDFSLS